MTETGLWRVLGHDGIAVIPYAQLNDQFSCTLFHIPDR